MPQHHDYILITEGTQGSTVTEYEFVVRGSVTPTDDPTGTSINDDFISIDGRSDSDAVLVSNAIADARNAYKIAGCIERFTVQSGPDPRLFRQSGGSEVEIGMGEVEDCEPLDAPAPELACHIPDPDIQVGQSTEVRVMATNFAIDPVVADVEVIIDGSVQSTITFDIPGESQISDVVQYTPPGTGQFGVSAELIGHGWA